MTQRDMLEHMLHLAETPGDFTKQECDDILSDCAKMLEESSTGECCDCPDCGINVPKENACDSQSCENCGHVFNNESSLCVELCDFDGTSYRWSNLDDGTFDALMALLKSKVGEPQTIKL